MTPSLDLLSLLPAIPSWLGAVLEASIKGTLILLAAALGAQALRRASAAARHFLWSTALGSLVLLPVLSIALPSWRVRVLPAARSAHAKASEIAGSAAFADTSAMRPAPALWPSEKAGVVEARPRARAKDHAATPLSPTANTVIDAPSSSTGAAEQPALRKEPSLTLVPARLTQTSALVFLWLSGVFVALLPLAVGLGRVRWLVRRARPAHARAWGALAADLAAEMGITRTVRIVESDERAMPMTFGTLRPVIVVPAGAERWPEARRRDVLLHELAHIQRHDALSQRIAQIACAIHWMNPCVWAAAARLHAERERACDDHVINAGAKAGDYARHLLEVARTLRAARITSAAAMAMARPSQLEGRLLAVLDGRISRRGVSRRLAAWGWLVAACMMLPLAAFRPAPAIDVAGEGPRRDGPFGGRRDAYSAAKQLSPRLVAERPAPTTGANVPLPAAAPAPESPAVAPQAPPSIATSSDAAPEPCWRQEGKGGSHSNWTQDDGRNRRWTVRWGSGRCRVEMEADGKIEFTSDLTDIASLSPHGSFALREIDGDVERRLEIMADGSGALTRRYWLNGREQPFDADGRAWLGGMLIELERMSAFAAETRVPQLLAAKGVSGVLDEIALMRGDYAKKVYFQTLFKLSPPKGADLERAVREAGRSVHSDYELAEILIALAGDGLVDKSLQAAYVEAIGSIDSDYERRRALTPLLKQPTLDPGLAPALFKAATGIKSDYELAELLLDISSRFAVDEKTRPDFFLAVNSIGSDYEQRRVLGTLLKQKGLGRQIIGDVLASAMKIDSDYEQAELLIQIAETQNLDGSLDDVFFKAVNTIGSDYEHARVLKTLLERERLSKASLAALLRSSATIDSDYEAAEVLTIVAGKYQLDDALKQEFMKAADSVGSEYDYGRVMAALRRRTASQN
jgi:beta-lactamase regulating signal transducer with metallopeptidase domain